MEATKELKEEHEGILHMLKILERISSTKREIEDFPFEHMVQIIDFLKVFVDQCHHGKEEDFLFPALEAAGIPREGGPIGVMLSEHQQGRQLVKEMTESLVRLRNEEMQGLADFQKIAQSYIELLRQHIEKENNVLFAMADQRLSGQRQNEMADSFEQLERNRIGVGRHEAFHALMDELSGIYLY